MHHCVVWFSHIPLRDSSGFSPDSLVFLLYEKGNAIRGAEELIASSIVKGDVRRCTWWRESFMKWGKFLEPRVVTVVVQLQWRDGYSEHLDTNYRLWRWGNDYGLRAAGL